MTGAPSPIPGYLSTADAAAYAKKSQEHIAKLCRDNTISAVRVGNMWLVEQASLDAYLASEPRPGVKPKRDQ